MLSPALLGVMLTLVLTLALAAPVYLLISMDLASVMIPGEWSVLGVLIDPADLVLAGMVLGLTLRKRRYEKALRSRIRHLRLWLLLGVLMSVAYVSQAQNQENFTDPVRLVYQLYRYCWKPILYYPLSMIVLRDRDEVHKVLLAIVLVGNALALTGIRDGYAGFRASGPFSSGNALGGALLIPLLISFLWFLRSNSHGLRLFCAASTLLMARAMVFTASRGAFVATLVGAGVGVCVLLAEPRGRLQVARGAAWGTLLIVLLMAVKPGALDGPNIGRLMTITKGTQDGNLRWRMEQRWPIFWDKVVANPWLGTGSGVDPRLGTVGSTPHNGFLALAVTHGVPAALIFIALACIGVHGGISTSLRANEPWERTLGLMLAACLMAVFTHNIVDQTLDGGLVAKLFWMLTALGVTASSGTHAFATPSPRWQPPSLSWPSPVRSQAGRVSRQRTVPLR